VGNLRQTIGFALGLIAATASAADPLPPGLPTLKIEVRGGEKILIGTSPGGTSIELGKLKTFAPGTLLFHWCDPDSYQRYVSSGQVPPSEFTTLRQNSGGLAAGGGYYASRNPVNSAAFGPKLVGNEIQTEITYLSDRENGLGANRLFKNLDTGKIFGNPKITTHQAFTLLLEGNGIFAYEYQNADKPSAWINFFDRNSLGRLRPVSDEEVFHAFLLGAEPSGISVVTQFAPHFPILDNAELAARLPEYSAYYFGRSTPAGNAAYAKILHDEFSHYLTTPNVPIATSLDAFAHENPFFLRIRADFRDPIDSAFRLAYTHAKAIAEETGHDDLLANIVRGAIFYGVDPAHLDGLDPAKLTFLHFPEIYAGGADLGEMGTSFRKNIEVARAWLDRRTLLDAIAAKNSAPWLLLERPGLASFQTRVTALMNYAQSSGSMAPTKEALLKARSIMLGVPNPSLRDSPLVAGGAIKVGGKSYYRLNAIEKTHLENHPFLVSEIIPDPTQAGEFLARHEYPSARTYSRIKAWLSPALLADLEKAEKSGNLAKTTTSDFRSLTRRIVEELLPTDIGFGNQAAHTYALLAALAPFSDENALSIRALMHTSPFTNVLYRDPDETLFRSPMENVLDDLQAQTLGGLVSHLFDEAEARNPSFPDYYRVFPGIFQDDPEFSAASLTDAGYADAWSRYQNSSTRKAADERRFQVELSGTACAALLKPTN
jgi:hypothetical protein